MPPLSVYSLLLPINIDVFDKSKSFYVPIYLKILEIVEIVQSYSKVFIKVKEITCSDITNITTWLLQFCMNKTVTINNVSRCLL